MPTSVEAVIVLVLLVSPGVIFTQLARRSIAHIEESTDIRFLVTMITTGAALHVVAFPWSNRVLGFYLNGQLGSHRGELYFWAIVVVFGVPALLGALSGLIIIRPSVDRLLNRIGLGYIDRMPSAWDYVMQQEAPRYVRVHLKDGGVIGGIFAGQSFGSTAPSRADIYLEQAWQLDKDGTFLYPIPTSQGVWISHDSIAFVHFLEGLDTPDEPTANATGANGEIERTAWT